MTIGPAAPRLPPSSQANVSRHLRWKSVRDETTSGHHVLVLDLLKFALFKQLPPVGYNRSQPAADKWRAPQH
jgi:hypothetical protein